MRKLFLLLLAIMVSVSQLLAQTTNPATAMESHGKIYVVMAVCLTILAGIVIYLIRIDRKVSRLEKKND